jgi:hypothetical protein
MDKATGAGVTRGTGKTTRMLEKLLAEDRPGRTIVVGVHTGSMVPHVRHQLTALRPKGLHARWFVREVTAHENLRGTEVV